jgi:hypothetical protein
VSAVKQARRVAAGLRRRLGRYRQRLRDAMPRRLPAWQDAATSDAGGDDITVATTGALRRHLTDQSHKRLHVVVEDWRTPYPGWSGRLGPLPHLRRHEVALPAGGRGRAEVTVELDEPAHRAKIIAAVLRALQPDRPLPATVRADLALDGPVPGWLPPAEVDRTPAGPNPEDAIIRPYDVRVDASQEIGAVDATTAKPTNRRRYDDRLPAGRLLITEGGRWQVDNAADGTTVLAGRVGEPLDDRQRDVLADLSVITSINTNAEAHATTLVQLAMTGVRVHAANPPRDLLGDELADLLATEPKDTDPIARELASVRQRRAAMRRHATAFALPRATKDTFPTLTTPPAVTALLMTRRPDRLATVLADLEAQTYPEIEIVVGLHGVDLTETLRRQLDAHARPTRLVTVHKGVGFGEALGEATRHASGSLLTKVDDDDLYGPEHIWDLVLARHYSGAEVVGKGAEFVYLEPRDQTVRRRMGNEFYTDVVAGGTMLLAKGDLEAVGGWRPVTRSVDRALLDRVLADGGLVYRTHGFGFIYTRHGDGHTWDPGLDYFARDPVRTWNGLPPYEEFGAR